MKEKLKEFEVVKAMGWLEDAPEVMRKEPVVRYEKLPLLSVQANVAVAVKCLMEPREKTVNNKDYAFMDVELVEPALLYDKATEKEFKAPKGTKASINLKRHASLWRNFSKNFLPCTGKELVIANLDKRTFKTDKTATGKATGFEYRIMPLEELKAKMKPQKK